MDIPVRTVVFSCFGLNFALTPFVTQINLETLRVFRSVAYTS